MNLKQHFTIEAKEYWKKWKEAADDTYQVANITNQALLEAQADFRDCTKLFLSEFQNALAYQDNPVEEPS